MTLTEIANSVPFRTDLARILNEPNLMIALQALAEDNMPDLKLSVVPGMDPMDAIALDYAKRCGAQAVIRRLKLLPTIQAGQLAKARAVGQPWEYIESEEDQQPTKLPRKR